MNYNSLIIVLIVTFMIQSLPGEERSKADEMELYQRAGPEYYGNVALSLGVGDALGLSYTTLMQYSEAHQVSEVHSISSSTFFYPWKGDPFSQKGMKELVDKLKPTIKKLEDKYGFKLYESSFSSNKDFEKYKPDYMPEVSFSFSDPKNDKLTYSCVVLVFHTAPTVLAINVTSIFPPLK